FPSISSAPGDGAAAAGLPAAACARTPVAGARLSRSSSPAESARSLEAAVVVMARRLRIRLRPSWRRRPRRTIAAMTGTAEDRSLLTRIGRRIVFSRAFRRLVRWGRRIVLPGFEGFSVYEIARLYFRALLDGMLMTRAAAISFKLF